MTFDASLDLRGLPEGDYNVLLGVFEGEKPIKLALKSEIETPDGYYRIARRHTLPRHFIKPPHHNSFDITLRLDYNPSVQNNNRR